MTKDLPQIDNICHQCNGYHCRDVYTEAYKNCDRWKMLGVLQEYGNYDILAFNNESICYLAQKIVHDVNTGKYFPPEALVNRAIRIVQQWT